MGVLDLLDMSRRSLMATVAAVAAVGMSRTSVEAEDLLKLEPAAHSQWMANQVALTSKNVMFLGCPRSNASQQTPSLARRNEDGTMSAFPGNGWNEWKPGDDGREAFIYLNSVHIFADDTVWCVDQGSVNGEGFDKDLAMPKPGAQKLVQLDPVSGDILKVIRFDDTILPPGAKMNDLRFHGSVMYITDSGLGAIIVHDLETGLTLRRLSGKPQMVTGDRTVTLAMQPGAPEEVFHPPNSDMIEITADGQWLYWATPIGPLYKIQTRLLRNKDLTDVALAGHVQHVADIEFSSGCIMDDLGNIYFCETKTGHVTLLTPSGQKVTLTSNPALLRPDGAFIAADRRFYVPIKPKAPDAPPATPYIIYSMELPESFGGTQLGKAVTGTM